MVLMVAGAAGFGIRAVAGDGYDEAAKTAKAGANASAEAVTVFGVEVTSDKLRAALAGFEMNEKSVRCPGCRAALKNDGTCEHCHVSMAHGKAYRSPVAYALAKGTPMPAELVAACPKRCDQCKTMHKENGFCTACNVGFVADRMYSNEEDYRAAVAAHETLAKAAKAAESCEACAVALVTDGTCDQCKVQFKDGKVAKHTG